MGVAEDKLVLSAETSVLAISNVKAKGVSKSGPVIDLAQLPEGSFHHLSQSKDDLASIITQAESCDVRHILIEGGDGTVRTVMTSLLNTYGKDQLLPAISIIPSGTTNQIARNLGLKKVNDIVKIYNGLVKETTMPLVKVRVKGEEKSEANPLYGFLFSTGALPHVSRFAQEEFNKKGVGGGTAVVGAVLKAVTGNKSQLMPPTKHKMKARLGQNSIFKHKGVVLGTVMTTLPTLMLGLDPFWGEENGPLRITWAKADSRGLGRTIAGLWVGRKQNRTQDGFYSYNIDRLNLRTKAPITLDGDFLDISGKSLSISASRPVRFWQAA